VSRLTLSPTQPPIQRVPWALSLEIKRPGREADHSPSYRAEVKNDWSYTFALPICLHSVVLSQSTGTTLPNIVTINWWRMRWMGHVARITDMRNSYKIFIGKFEAKRKLRDLGLDGTMIL